MGYYWISLDIMESLHGEVNKSIGGIHNRYMDTIYSSLEWLLLSKIYLKKLLQELMLKIG